jgi:hypothetical protein
MNFKITSEWLRQTDENMNEERAYKTALANNESTDSFKVITRGRYKSKRLVHKHNVPQYDETLFNFINETTQTISQLHNRISELETKLSVLENKQ